MRRETGIRWAVGAMLGLTMLPGWDQPAGAYLFYGDGRTGDRVVSSEHAARWARSAWGPGEALVFEIAPQPEFEVFFGSPAGALPYLERAVKAWSSISTANIEFRVGGVDEDLDIDNVFMDDRNTVFIDVEWENFGGYAAGHSTWRGNKWVRQSCDVAFGNLWGSRPEWAENNDAMERTRERSVFLLVHEIGHCIGLGHAGALSATGRWAGSQGFVQRRRLCPPVLDQRKSQSIPRRRGHCPDRPSRFGLITTTGSGCVARTPGLGAPTNAVDAPTTASGVNYSPMQ